MFKDRHGQRIVTNFTPGGEKLAIIAHGMAGHMEQPFIVALKEAFIKKGYSVLRYDAPNNFGQSDGTLENLTITGHIQALEDVIAWAKPQPWYTEPFALAGHSIGALAVFEYAAHHPNKIEGIIALSPNLAGTLRLEAYKKHTPRAIERFESRGYLNIKDPETGQHGRLMKAYLDDFLTHDVRPLAPNLTMPVTIITGAADTITEPAPIKDFYTTLPQPDGLHIVVGADHVWSGESLKNLGKRLNSR